MNAAPPDLRLRAGAASDADVYLHPGHIAVCPEPARITTILGSCVSVCLFDRRRRVGGASHHQLPLWAGEGHRSARFGNVALEMLLQALQEEGCRRPDLEAKVFGGACVLDAFRERTDHLGTKNVDVALGLLDQWSIPVASRDVGGQRGRKLVFATGSGLALVRLL